MFLTKRDYANIKELFREIFREMMNFEPGQTLDSKLSYLPTKEEFFTKEDEVLKELKTVRVEMQTLNGLHEKVNRHEDEIEKLQKIHPNSKHSLAI